jgi:hypothetical protein
MTAGSAPEELSAEIGRAPLWVFEKMVELADRWGGSFDARKGRLELPVTAGLRYGRVVAEVEALARRDGAKLRVKVVESHYQVDRGSTFALAVAAVAAIASLVLPFFPHFWPLLPPALIIAVAGWLFIVARLRTSGVEDFLAELSNLAGEPPAGAPPDDGDEPGQAT